MVLSAPPAHDPQGAGDAGWLERITRVFRRTEKGVLVLCDHATDARLRDLVRHLCRAGLSPEVLAAPGQLAEVPTGSVVVLAVRPDDATWLNLNRPVFQERALRVVLWSSEETTTVLAQRAPDTYDWISHRVECPPGVPRHAVAGFRAALRSRAPGIEWTGEKLDEVFAQALPGRPLRRVSAKTTDLDLHTTIRGAGRAWLVCSDVTGRRPLGRLRHTLEGQRRRTRVILDHPAVVSRDLWPVHDRLVSVEAALQQLVVAGVRAPGRMAALAGLEPEAVELLAELSERSRQRAGEARETEELERLLIEADDPGEALGRRWLHVEAERRRTATENGAAIESGRLRRSSPVWRAAVKDTPAAAPWTRHDEPHRPGASLSSKPASEYPASRWPVGSHGPMTEEDDPDEDPFAKSARLDAREHELRYAVLQAQAADDRQAEAQAQLAFGDYLVGRQRWREAEQPFRTALHLAQEQGNRAAQATALVGLADLAHRSGQLREAMLSYKEALVLAREPESQPLRATILFQLGIVATQTRSLREAEGALRSAFDGFLRAGEMLGAATAQARLGRVLFETGRVREAETELEAASLRFSQVGQPAGRAWTLVTLAEAYRITNRFEEAEAACRESLVLHEQLSDDEGVAVSLRGLTLLFLETGRPREAESHCRRALALQERRGDRLGQGRSLLDLGVILLAEDRLAEAEEAFRSSLSLHQSLGNRAGQARALQELGRLSLNQGQWRAAFKRLSIARATHHALDDVLGVALATASLGQACLGAGRPLQAIAWLSPALRSFESMGTVVSQRAALEDLSLAFARIGRPEAAQAATLLREEAPPDDLAPARDTLAAAIAEAEAEFQASGEDLFAPPPE